MGFLEGRVGSILQPTFVLPWNLLTSQPVLSQVALADLPQVASGEIGTRDLGLVLDQGMSPVFSPFSCSWPYCLPQDTAQ